MAEAMSLGKPVIATGYSGNLEFMNGDNSLLVPYRLTSIGEGSFPYDPGSVWAEPDLEVAAEYMKKIFTDSDFARALGLEAKNSVLRNHSIDKTVDFILSRIKYQRSFFGILVNARIHVRDYFLFIVKEFIKSNIKFVKTIKRYSTYD
jgi:glycosyltransferase involved in cell wall biosynthesis